MANDVFKNVAEGVQSCLVSITILIALYFGWTPVNEQLDARKKELEIRAIERETRRTPNLHMTIEAFQDSLVQMKGDSTHYYIRATVVIENTGNAPIKYVVPDSIGLLAISRYMPNDEQGSRKTVRWYKPTTPEGKVLKSNIQFPKERSEIPFFLRVNEPGIYHLMGLVNISENDLSDIASAIDEKKLNPQFSMAMDYIVVHDRKPRQQYRR